MEERASLVTVDMCCQEKKVPLQGVNVIWCVCGVCEARGLVGDGGEMPRTLGQPWWGAGRRTLSLNITEREDVKTAVMKKTNQWDV